MDQLDAVNNLEGFRLRIQTLEKERDFLGKEGSLLKARISELSNKYQKLETRFNKLSNDKDMSERALRESKQLVRKLNTRCHTTERIAAFLEKLNRELAPNSRPDYKTGLASEQEPSAQLLSALTTAADEELATI